MANNQTLDVDLSAFAEALQTDVTTAVRTVAAKLFGEIVDASPVDTGRFRAGWAVTLDAPSEFIPGEASTHKDKLVKGHGPGSRLAPEYADAPMFPSLEIGLENKVFIVNNLPYAVALEDGHSMQAPPGAIVQIPVERMALNIDNFIAKNP